MRARLLFVTSALAMTVARVAAADKAACLDAANKGQQLHDAHKLVEARGQFRICAAAECPAVVQTDCASWLETVEKAIPSVVLAARSAAGEDLFDVKVTMDGQPLAAKLDGQAIAIDPGAHTFRFEDGTGGAAEQHALVLEGAQSQTVSVVLKRTGPPTSTPVPAPPPAASSSTPVASPTTSATPSATPASTAPAGGSPAPGPWRTVGWVAGGVGLVGLAIGTVFGAMAMADTNSADCDSKNQCLPGPLNDARHAALVSDVGLVAGGVLLAGGAALVFLGRGAGESKPAPATAIRPVLSPYGGGLTIRASW